MLLLLLLFLNLHLLHSQLLKALHRTKTPPTIITANSQDSCQSFLTELTTQGGEGLLILVHAFLRAELLRSATVFEDKLGRLPWHLTPIATFDRLVQVVRREGSIARCVGVTDIRGWSAACNNARINNARIVVVSITSTSR
jgi:hypothetical protein